MSSQNSGVSQYDAAEARVLDALAAIVSNAGSPETLEAQTILLRRLALQGDVVGSRIPAPLNITQIGGYINLLETLKQPEMQAQMLAGILGVAGPNPPLGWISSKPKFSMISVANDRPEGIAQRSIPTSFAIRLDFLPGIQDALKAIHEKGCALPLLSNYNPLPEPMLGVPAPSDVLSYIGRTLDIVPASALQDPEKDSIAIGRPDGNTGSFDILARALKADSTIQAANWETLKCDTTSCASTIVQNAKYLPISPILGNAGFYPQSPLPKPETQSATKWAHFTNITGLVTGVTRLVDELILLHPSVDISRSVFVPCLNWVWNGTQFVSL